MSRRLYAWDGDRLVGVFTRDGDGDTSFAYNDVVGGMPISLSLPRNGGWKSDAPAAFLDNLLPDNPNARRAMGSGRGFGSTDTFDLLADVDSVGGLVFTREPEPPSGNVVLAEATAEQLANEADRIARNGNNWWDDDMHCRFSLAGAQGKFTLTRIGGAWYWPNALLPSTHIIKPAPRRFPDVAQVEAATMRLAALCGLDAPALFVESMGGTTVYVVERFDRRIEQGRVRRIRQEDLLQAMGLPSGDKYEATADDCLDLLAKVDPTGELRYRWLERLAFAVSSADCDVHAKNYSLLYDGMGIRLAPVYDAVATRYWPVFDQELAMPVNPEHQFAEWTTPQDWAALASRHGLDPDRVVDTARRIAGLVLARMPETVEGMDERIAGRLQSCWAKANESIEPIQPDLIDQQEVPETGNNPMDFPPDPDNPFTPAMPTEGPLL